MNIYSLRGDYMPRRNKTGPAGKGPLTGRGLGPCGQKEETSRFFERGNMAGFGRGGGFGFGRERSWKENLNLSREEKKKILSEELKEIEIQKQRIEKDIKKIEEEE